MSVGMDGRRFITGRCGDLAGIGRSVAHDLGKTLARLEALLRGDPEYYRPWEIEELRADLEHVKGSLTILNAIAEGIGAGRES